jgi:hypothetical protein
MQVAVNLTDLIQRARDGDAAAAGRRDTLLDTASLVNESFLRFT